MFPDSERYSAFLQIRLYFFCILIMAVEVPARFLKQKLFIPGDNDCGGEGRDMYSPSKQFRFSTSFDDTKQMARVGFDFLNFIRVYTTHLIIIGRMF